MPLKPLFFWLVLGLFGVAALSEPGHAVDIDLEGDIEVTYERSREIATTGSTVSSERESLTALNLEADLLVQDDISVFADYESEFSGGGKGRFNALFLRLVRDPVEMQLGRRDDLFAHSESVFLSSPFTEFGELETEAVSVRFGLEDQHAWTGFLYRRPELDTDADSSSRKSGDTDAISSGLSYRTALPLYDAVIEVGIVEDLLIYGEVTQLAKTAGLHITSIIRAPRAWLLLEHTRALRDEIDRDFGAIQPNATAVEIVIFASERLQFGTRLDYTRELPDAPETRLGILSLLSAGDGFVLGAEVSRLFYSSDGLRGEDSEVDEATIFELSIKFEF